MKFKLTTECGYRWRLDQMYYWKNFYKPRLLNKGWVNGVRVKVPATGVAFGPVMFFWKWE